MRTKKNYLWLFAIGLILMSLSCIKDTDLDQLEEAVLTPVYELDFMYSDFDVQEFTPSNLPPNTEFEVAVEQLRDTVNYDLIGTDFAIDHIEKVELTIEIRNTIETPFELRFQFLTETNEPLGDLYTIQVRAGEGEGTDPIISPQSGDPNNPIILNNADFIELSNSQKIATQIVVPTLNTDLRGAIHIRSKASYYINYDL